MLDDYFKKIESFISPTHYSRDNYKDKIMPMPVIKETLTETSPLHVQECNQNENSKSQQMDSIDNLLNTNKKEQIIKLKQENQGKLEIPEENKANLTESLNQRKTYTYRQKEYTDNDIKSLFEKMHKLNLKCMNYRYENEKLKSKLLDEEKAKNDIALEKEKIEKKNENLTKHLLKLEEYISKMGKTSPESTITSHNKLKESESKMISTSNSKASWKNNNSDLQSIVGFNANSNIKVEISPNNSIIITETVNGKQKVITLNNLYEIKSFLLKQYKDNYKLKNFQAQVYDLSKTYDDINENLLESIRHIQTIVDSKTENKEGEENLIKSYKELVENVDKTLETKQKEYNILLSTKEDEINLIQEELLTLNNEIQVRKKDRLKDQQLISELQREIDDIKMKGGFYEYDNNDFRSINKENRFNNDIDNRIEPVKKTLNKIVKNIEKNFNMKDKNNVNMIGNIQRTVHN